MDTTTIESGKQATLEDLIEWRHITDHWVKRSCSTETNDAICPSWFYLEFCKLCRQTILIKESSLAEFLQSHFPDFELVLSADGNVLLMDSVYVCSLLLYFSCVRYPVAYLRNVCKQFDESQQQRIKTFFKHFLTGRKINRGFLDSAVFNAVRSTPIAKQTPKWDDGLATPDSPHELHYKNKNLDQQLKTALAENASLEKQNEQLQRELHDLNEKNKRLVLRLEVLEEAGSDRNGKETLLEVTDFNTVYLRKQLIEKDEQLERLEAEMCVLKTKEENFKNDHGRLGFENRALQEEITSLQSRLQVATVEFEKVEGNNQLLRDQLLEFERYIDGNRVVFPPEILDSSNDFLNMSSNISLNQSCSPDGESLASSVVEVMLQEAKTQNQQLQSKLNQLEKELKFAKEQNMLNTETNNQLGQQTLLVQTEMIDLETRHHMALNAEKTETAKLPVALEEKSEQSIKQLQEVDSFQNERDELITKIEELSSALEKEKLCSAEWKLKWEEKDSDYRQTVDNLRKEKQGLIDEIKEMSAALEKEKLCSAEWKLKWEEKDSDYRQTVDNLRKEKQGLIDEIKEMSAALEKEKLCSAEWKLKWEEKDSDYRQTVDNLRKEKQELIDEIKEMSAALEKEKLCSAEWKLKWEEKDSDHRQTVNNLRKEKQGLIDEIKEMSSVLEKEKLCSAEWKLKWEEKDSDYRQTVNNLRKEKQGLIDEIKEMSSVLEKEKLCSAEWKLKWEEKDSDYRQTVDNLRKEKQGLIDEIKEMSSVLEKEKLCSAEWKLKWEEKDYDHRPTVEYLQMEKEALIKEIEELGSTIEKKWKSKDNEQCMQASSYVQQIRVLQEEQDEQAKKLQKHQATYTTIKEEMEMALETKKLQGVLEQQTINEVEYDRKLSDFQKKVQELYVSLESNKTHNTQLQVNLDEREEKLQEYEQQINYLQNKLADVESQCINLIKQNSVQQNELFEKARKNEELCNNLTATHKKMQQIQEMLARSNRSVQQDGESLQQRQRHFSDPVTQASAEQIKELQAKYEKYYHDCEILSAKLYKERLANEKWKEEMIAIRESYDQEKRATCISYEESMEKMKERMKRLHKDSKDALEHSYKEKLVQLEVRCAQLQEQLAEKNERDLAIRKENQILLAKVKTLEENKLERYGRFLLPAPAQACLRDNLRMEDEEGELFNATYLADLQVGRCWSPGADTVRYSELLQRNSMVPPHLRTNYGTMYPDCDVVASDTPDSISEGFDDSSTGLITRRKVSGTTSYKRPGPPTPSKKAGRVSFGGILPISNNQVQYKEALKNRNANSARSSSATTTSHNHSDPLINDAKTAGRTKTPGKFKQMLSSSNLLGNFNQRNEVTKKNFFPYYI
ncbi:putative leucine-rich repeat-containing protein DDB_G0290503 isoform X2 [Anopheles darlingi]|uniref:putative leucine-rich repeat-containing protein DDB_G0290503 isoform X2 n=1 Tax=Anopheles darlingi TaxID=43151 RepID=UPI0021006390|nr:putative leucine-rich repeat-containing protein DDB_G0290503 isoform X2 [Anopheles darlingi]